MLSAQRRKIARERSLNLSTQPQRTPKIATAIGSRKPDEFSGDFASGIGIAPPFSIVNTETHYDKVISTPKEAEFNGTVEQTLLTKD